MCDFLSIAFAVLFAAVWAAIIAALKNNDSKNGGFKDNDPTQDVVVVNIAIADPFLKRQRGSPSVTKSSFELKDCTDQLDNKACFQEPAAWLKTQGFNPDDDMFKSNMLRYRMAKNHASRAAL